MNITKKFGKNILATVLVVAVLIGILAANIFSAATIRFVDVPKTEWFYEDVTVLAEKGVVSGIGQNKFAPFDNVAYCEMTKMVVNAFFRSDYNSFEAAHFLAMNTRFGNNLYWFSFMSYYAKMNEMNGVRLLDGIDVDIDSYADSYRPMSRYDMAMILANAAKAKGITVTEAQKAAAQSNILDYASIPAKYQDAVKTCFALQTQNAKGENVSLLNGKNGYFAGSDNMTRAEACAVIVRLDNLIANGGGTVVDPDPTPSTPDEPTVKDIVVTSETWSGTNGSYGAISGNAWTITDNGFGDGYLANGKPITEENVTELLHEAEKIWPTGIKWSENGSGNNFYKSSGTVSASMLKTQTTGTSINVSSNFGCGGYAAMISDYLFGRDNNMFHRVPSVNNIRPGDIIVEVTNNKVVHVMVAVTTSGGAYGETAVTRNGYVHVVGGNVSDKVAWPNKFAAPLNENSDSTTTWQIYSRYPA